MHPQRSPTYFPVQIWPSANVSEQNTRYCVYTRPSISTQVASQSTSGPPRLTNGCSPHLRTPERISTGSPSATSMTTSWANIRQSHRPKFDANLDTFNEPIDASCTISVYIRKQEICQEMAEDAHVPITEATMVTTGTNNAVATGAWMMHGECGCGFPTTSKPGYDGKRCGAETFSKNGSLSDS